MIYNPLDIYPVIGLLGQVEFLFLGTRGIATPSSTVVELIYTPTNSVKAFLFLHNLASISCFLTYNNCHFNWCEMVSHCGFNLQFSNGQWCWAFFHIFIGHMNFLSWEVSVHVLCPLLMELFFLVNCEVLIDCGYYTSIRCIVCKNFLPFSRLSVYSIDSLFCCAEPLKSN